MSIISPVNISRYFSRTQKAQSSSQPRQEAQTRRSNGKLRTLGGLAILGASLAAGATGCQTGTALATLEARIAGLEKRIDEQVTLDEVASICREVRPSIVKINHDLTSVGLPLEIVQQMGHAHASGVVVATIDGGKKGGYIATNWHVLNLPAFGIPGITEENLKTLEVELLLHDDTKIKAKPFYITDAEGKSILAKSEEYELALLKTDDDISSIKPISFADKEPESGEPVLVIGSPFGLEQSISLGVVSAIRSIDFTVHEINPDLVDGKTIAKVIQTDAAINPGSSGGAIISIKDGKFVSMSTFIMPDSIFHGVAFGNSAPELARVIETWIPSHTLDDSGRFVEN